MATAKITLLGMYQWTNGTIFSDVTVPEGLDKDLFINTLLMEKGELETLWADPDFFKMCINVWAAKWQHTFTEWLRGVNAQYSPIENYDRYEDTGITKHGSFASKTQAKYDNDRTLGTTDTLSPASTKTTTYNNVKDNHTFTNYKETDTFNTVKDTESFQNYKETRTYQNVKDTHDQTVNGTTEHDVSGYDSGTLVPSWKDTVNAGTTSDTRSGSEDFEKFGSHINEKTGNTTHEIGGSSADERTGNTTETMSGSDTTTHTGMDKLHTEGTLNDTLGGSDSTDTTTSHIHGNIGVTTNAQLLEGFYKISAWNIYNQMADTFSMELLVNVY